MVGIAAIVAGLALLVLAAQLMRQAFAARPAGTVAPRIEEAAAPKAAPRPRKRVRSDSMTIDLHPRRLEEGEEFALPTRLTACDPLLRPLAPAAAA